MDELSYAYDTEIYGNIQLEINIDSVDLADNYVAGDVQVFYNYDDDYSDDAYGVLIEYNIIEGNLQCKENDPMPYGGYNDVKGNMEDQCEYLEYRESDGGNTDTTGSGAGSAASANSPGASTDALTETSGGGASGPFLSLLLCAVAMLRLRRQRKLVA